jgi:aminopeptidase N
MATETTPGSSAVDLPAAGPRTRRRIRRRQALPLALLAAALATALGSDPRAVADPGAAAAERDTFAPAGQAAHYPGDRRYHLRHVRLDLTFDLRHATVAGTATNTVSPLLPGLEQLSFHAAGLKVTRVRLAPGGLDLSFAVEPTAQRLDVRLPHAFGPADQIEVAIDYSAAPRAGLYFSGPDAAYPNRPRQMFSDGEPELNRYWFPSWDEPDERASTELLATVERPYQAISNGRLEAVVERADGRRTFHWRMEQPHAMYLTSVVIGEFARTEDHWQGVPLEFYVPPQLASQSAAAFSHTADMMDYFSRLTGVPYPYEKYSQVTVDGFMWGGMENISATTETTDTLRDARAMLDATSDDLVSHELAHQWFGDYVTCRTWAHSWLSEGMATYFEALYRQHQTGPRGDDEMAWKLDSYRQSYILEDRDDYRRPLVTSRYVSPIRLFDSHTYDKGALVMHMLRYLTGEDGWWQGIHTFLTRHALGTVISQDFESALEDASGVELGAVFDQFVYGAGYPEIKLHWEYQGATAMVHLEVLQMQDTSRSLTGFFSFPVEVALIGDSGAIEVRRVQMLAQQRQDIYMPSASRPRNVVFDPRGALLKTLDFDKPTAEWIEQLRAELPLAAHLDAVRALAERGGDDETAALGEALLHHRFRGVRQVAAAGLEQIASGAALAFLERATRDPDPHVRAAVFASFGAFPENHELIAQLAHALASDESYGVRSGAAAALGHFVTYRSEVTPLLRRALHQPSYLEAVAAMAIRALANLGAPETFADAALLARYGSPPAVRDDAMVALARAAAEGSSTTQKREARRILEGYLADPDFNIRLKVPEALGELGDPAAIPALERSWEAEVEDEQRQPREKAIRQLRQAAAKPAPTTTQGLEDRVQQLERANEVLQEQLRRLQADRPAAPAESPPPAPPHF